jgi:mono/diheme cytochrome c family protein
MTRLALVGMLGVIVGATTAAASASDVAAGRDLALDVCSNCHVVAADQRFPPTRQPPAPALRVIANKPDTTAASLARLLHTAHPTTPGKMPDFDLNDAEVAKVVSYILSLRGQR